MPITVNDPSVELELLYIDDLIAEMICALKGEEHRCEFNGLEVIPMSHTENNSLDSANSACQNKGRYCYCPVTHKATLGHIVELLNQFKEMPKTLLIPEIGKDSFAKRLYSTYLSYLPKEGAIFDLKMNVDNRGSFTELVHTLNCGQVSINISKPGITKGQHWHHTKWEQFIVVKGHGLIQMRPENPDQIEKNKGLVDSLTCCHVDQNGVISYEVSGDRIQSVIMLPGYTHNIINLSDTEDLVTVMYCNEIFDPQRPDTFFDPV